MSVQELYMWWCLVQENVGVIALIIAIASLSWNIYLHKKEPKPQIICTHTIWRSYSPYMPFGLSQIGNYPFATITVANSGSVHTILTDFVCKYRSRKHTICTIEMPIGKITYELGMSARFPVNLDPGKRVLFVFYPQVQRFKKETPTLLGVLDINENTYWLSKEATREILSCWRPCKGGTAS